VTGVCLTYIGLWGVHQLNLGKTPRLLVFKHIINESHQWMELGSLFIIICHDLSIFNQAQMFHLIHVPIMKTSIFDVFF